MDEIKEILVDELDQKVLSHGIASAAGTPRKSRHRGRAVIRVEPASISPAAREDHEGGGAAPPVVTVLRLWLAVSTVRLGASPATLHPFGDYLTALADQLA